MFFANNPFEAVRKRSDLNGLQKLREVVRLNQSDESRTDMTVQSIPITRNSRILVEMIDSNRRILTPYFLELMSLKEPVIRLAVSLSKLLRVLPTASM